MPVNDVSGSVRLIGGDVGGQCEDLGELQFDSLVWGDLQFTGVRGPLWCDQSQCLSGQGAVRRYQELSQAFVQINENICRARPVQDTLSAQEKKRPKRSSRRSVRK